MRKRLITLKRYQRHDFEALVINQATGQYEYHDIWTDGLQAVTTLDAAGVVHFRSVYDHCIAIDFCVDINTSI